MRRCLERTGDCEQRVLGDKTECVIVYSLLSPGTGTDSNSETTEGERAGWNYAETRESSVLLGVQKSPLQTKHISPRLGRREG